MRIEVGLDDHGAGALLNVMVNWLEQGAKEPPEDMAVFCAQLLRDGLSTKFAS